MAQRIEIRENMYDQLMGKKKQEKIRYNIRIKTQYFKPSDFVFLKDLTPHLEKLIEQWREPFIIDSFDGDYDASDILKILDTEPTPNIYHDNYLHIFHA